MAGQTQEEEDEVTYVDCFNWGEVEVMEALHDWNWRNIAKVLHEMLKKEKNRDFRETLKDLEKFA